MGSVPGEGLGGWGTPPSYAPCFPLGPRWPYLFSLSFRKTPRRTHPTPRGSAPPAPLTGPQSGGAWPEAALGWGLTFLSPSGLNICCVRDRGSGSGPGRQTARGRRGGAPPPPGTAAFPTHGWAGSRAARSGLWGRAPSQRAGGSWRVQLPSWETDGSRRCVSPACPAPARRPRQTQEGTWDLQAWTGSDSSFWDARVRRATSLGS